MIKFCFAQSQVKFSTKNIFCFTVSMYIIFKIWALKLMYVLWMSLSLLARYQLLHFTSLHSLLNLMGRWGTNDNFELVSLYFSLSLTVKCFVERCGAVVKRRTRDREVPGSIPTNIKCWFYLSKKLYPHWLELVSIQEKRGSHGRLELVN